MQKLVFATRIWSLKGYCCFDMPLVRGRSSLHIPKMLLMTDVLCQTQGLEFYVVSTFGTLKKFPFLDVICRQWFLSLMLRRLDSLDAVFIDEKLASYLFVHEVLLLILGDAQLLGCRGQLGLGLGST